MEKIIADSKGQMIVYDTATNAIQESKKESYASMYKMTNDGELITNHEVIPYTKDSYLVRVRGYSKIFWFVIDDNATIFDIDNIVKADAEHANAAINKPCNGTNV